MDELEKLRTEIKILNKRISVLEGKERRRSAFKKIKFVVNVLILLAIGYGIWYSYDYLTNYIPMQIENAFRNLLP